MRICVDISSMSRPMMAQVVFGLSRLRKIDLAVEFVYCPAKYDPPPKSTMPIMQSGPVIPEYAGWSTRPDFASTLVVGLGYEYGRALGALEYLEPSAAWAFTALGDDRRYEKAVKKANDDLWNILAKDRIYEYKIAGPYDVACKLESLVYGLIQYSRPTLLPLGPKIFAIVCLLVAEIHYPAVTVWRVSGDQFETPTDRVADGNIVSFHVKFGKIGLVTFCP